MASFNYLAIAAASLLLLAVTVVHANPEAQAMILDWAENKPELCVCETCNPWSNNEHQCCDSLYPQCCGEMNCYDVPRNPDDRLLREWDHILDDSTPHQANEERQLVGRHRNLRQELLFLASSEKMSSPLVSFHELDNHEWDQYKERCNEYYYDLYLYVDTHIFLVAKPSKDKNDEVEQKKMKQDGCTYTVFHSELGNTQTTIDQDDDSLKQFMTMTKKVVLMNVLSNSENDVDTFWDRHEKDSLLSLTTNNLFYEYSTTFDKIDTSTSVLPTGDKDHNYDLILNNCGDFALNFCLLLGDVRFTPSMTKWVTKALIQNHSLVKLVKMIQTHPNLHVLQQQQQVAQSVSSDEDSSLVETLVESRTGELYYSD